MPPGPARSSSSKRNSVDWLTATLYLRREHKASMERFLALRKLTSATGPADQSELIAAALEQWLAQQLPAMEQSGMRDLIG